MDRINQEHLCIYLKYSGEYALLFERSANKKDMDKITGEQFDAIDQLISNLKMIESGKLSRDFHEKITKENLVIKGMMEPEVYEEILDYLSKNEI